MADETQSPVYEVAGRAHKKEIIRPIRPDKFVIGVGQNADFGRLKNECASEGVELGTYDKQLGLVVAKDPQGRGVGFHRNKTGKKQGVAYVDVVLANGNNREKDWKAHHVVTVRFKEGFGENERRIFAQKHSLTLQMRLEPINASAFSIPPSADTLEVATALDSQPEVLYAIPDWIVPVELNSLADAPGSERKSVEMTAQDYREAIKAFEKFPDERPNALLGDPLDSLAEEINFILYRHNPNRRAALYQMLVPEKVRERFRDYAYLLGKNNRWTPLADEGSEAVKRLAKELHKVHFDEAIFRSDPDTDAFYENEILLFAAEMDAEGNLNRLLEIFMPIGLPGDPYVVGDNPDDPIQWDKWKIGCFFPNETQPGAWDLVYGSSLFKIKTHIWSPTLAIIDTGIDLNHPDLNVRAGSDEPPVVAPIECGLELLGASPSAPHGTAVAGVAAAKGNNTYGGIFEGMAGVSWNADIFMENMVTSENDEIAIAEMAYHLFIAASATPINDPSAFVPVVNSSWSHPLVGDIAPISDLMTAMDEVLFVFAAGNGGPGTLVYPAMLAATIPNVMSVGATDFYDHPWSYSSQSSLAGQSLVSIWAPSGGGPTAFEDGGILTCNELGNSKLLTTDAVGNLGYHSGVGVGCCVNCCVNPSNLAPNLQNDLDYTTWMSGTSFAAPQVSGAALLVRSVNPYIKGAELKNLLIATADPWVTGQLADVTDRRLNALNAVEAALATGENRGFSVGLAAGYGDLQSFTSRTDVPRTLYFQLLNTSALGGAAQPAPADIWIDAGALPAWINIVEERTIIAAGNSEVHTTPVQILPSNFANECGRGEADLRFYDPNLPGADAVSTLSYELNCASGQQCCEGDCVSDQLCCGGCPSGEQCEAGLCQPVAET